MSEPLSWDATYAIAEELHRLYPQENLADISLKQIYLWVIALPEFNDDPELATEDILSEIFQIWFEETLHDT